MKLCRFKKNGVIVIGPKDKKYKPLFRHCSGGRDYVPSREFTMEVKPVLYEHYLSFLEIEDLVPTKKKEKK